MFTPSYSPILDPIEEAWSKAENHLRKDGARTRDDLWEAIAFAIELITEQDANGYFRHAGVMS